MYHYVYLLTFSNGMKYVGMHSTTIQPELDACYLGSGSLLPERDLNSCKKEILGTFDSREEASNYEIQEIVSRDAVKSEEYYNQKISCHDKHGSKLSEEHKENIRKWATGRVRTELRGKYLKGNRTPAQQANDERMRIETKGIKNPLKGLSGTLNSGFKPWYYITPEGNYVEVYDKTKQEMAVELGFTPRQLGHGFHHTNQHKKAKTLPRKGWIFGDLPRPTDMEED